MDPQIWPRKKATFRAAGKDEIEICSDCEDFYIKKIKKRMFAAQNPLRGRGRDDEGCSGTSSPRGGSARNLITPKGLARVVGGRLKA